ncbi:MAG: hypothetical protein KC680_01285 [Candidatus Peregrinibacteria bacterium]|nr:hypothetical protein [Candidatus Peregrinibacteria bacterium]MCB9808232.1 hypothetical protein [Candidatus Peribacteria bacterium]
MHQSRFHQLFLTVLIVAIAISGIGLLSYCWFQLTSGYLHGDALIFQTVGRGMLHGYKPYVDLFETKPPGVFLLHALSWKLFGSQLLVSLLSVACLLGIPILVTVPVVQERKVLILLTMLFGLTLALYVANQAGGGLAESYGAFFGVAFLGLLISERISTLKPLLLGILLLLAVGFKEPFLLSILAGVIVLTDRPKDLVTSFLVPVGITVVLGLIGLFAFSLFDPFFSIYLPHMLGFHVHQHDGSTFVHALEIWRTFINMGAYSWGFAGAITVLWLLAFSFQLSAFRYVAASYLTLLAIAIGGDFYGHHFVFAVPFYSALWWKFLGSGKWVFVLIATGLVFAALTSTQFSYKNAATQWKQKEVSMRQAATTIDDVMDACNWEKYLQIIPRVGDAFAYTDHVPYGPIFLHYARFIGARREYQTAFIHALNEAKLILVLDLQESNLSEDAIEFIGVHFDENPPACVGGEFSQPEPYSLLFRKN